MADCERKDNENDGRDVHQVSSLRLLYLATTRGPFLEGPERFSGPESH